jgi:hypothetical protein
MTTFSERERGEEAHFAHDEEMQFRITARRNRLLGQWAAERMGLSAAETDAYAKSVVIRKLLGDLTSAGVETDEAEVRAALEIKLIEARRMLMGES